MSVERHQLWPIRLPVAAAIVVFATFPALATSNAYAETPVLQLAQSCHPSYEGECVPITSDADCAAGSGNGPAYVRGPVRVVGPDEYGLDRDGDGWGCE